MRQSLAYLCFSLASFFKFFGKMIRSETKTLPVDTLTIPGWFIVGDNLIRMKRSKDDKLSNGMSWEYYSMPDSYIVDFNSLKARVK